jgi:hypothetical protein
MAAPVGLGEYAPAWLARPMVGRHAPALQAFRKAHPELRMTAGHACLECFQGADAVR